MMQAAKDSIDLGIMCGDIHASLHFYHDLLGLPNVGVTEATTAPCIACALAPVMSSSSIPRTDRAGLHRQSPTTCLRYLTFVVTNLDEVIQRLEAAHMAFTRPKTTIRPGTTIAMVQDPDGNMVAFVERG